MALQGAGQNLGPLYPQIHPANLDGRNGGLRNAGEFRQLTLA